MNTDLQQASLRPDDSETQQKILAAARAEFAALGKAGGRIDHIASEAGVNKAMIYYHFNSKDNLYLEAVLSVVRTAQDSFSTVLNQDQSLEEILLGIADVYEEMFVRSPEYRAMMLRELASPDSPVLKLLGERIAKSRLPGQLLQRLQTEIELKTARPIDLRQTLVSFLMMNIGYYLTAPLVNRIMQVTDPVTFRIERKKAVVDLFLHGVRARK
jgi:TetR/AcrR family transcriptional regulator